MKWKNCNIQILLLVPLVAFDNKFKFRLGYGGGFYDRYIAAFRKRRNKVIN